MTADSLGSMQVSLLGVENATEHNPRPDKMPEEATPLPTPEPALVLFDGVCNLCQGSVQFILLRDPKGRFRFASLQSDEGRRRLAEHGLNAESLNSVVLIEDGKVFRRSTAALRIARHLSGAWPLAAVFWIVPRPLRDLVYDFVARNRYRWFGKTEACMVPRPEWRARFLG